MDIKKPSNVPPTKTGAASDDANDSGVRRAWHDVKRGMSEAVQDVKEGIAHIKNSPRFGGMDPNVAANDAPGAPSLGARAADGVARDGGGRWRREAPGVPARRAVGSRDVTNSRSTT